MQLYQCISPLYHLIIKYNQTFISEPYLLMYLNNTMKGDETEAVMFGSVANMFPSSGSSTN